MQRHDDQAVKILQVGSNSWFRKVVSHSSTARRGLNTTNSTQLRHQQRWSGEK